MLLVVTKRQQSLKAVGGEIKELPVMFEFGLLVKHNMGDWDVKEEKNDFFSFTFRVILID